MSGTAPIYLIRGGDIELISTLHTVMAEQEALAPEGAKPLGNQFRHMLTRAVGTRETVRVDTVEFPYLADDIIVICSDGLSDLVTPEEVLQKATTLVPEEASQRLMELANERGGDDNITIIVLRIGKDAENETAGPGQSPPAMKKTPSAPGPRAPEPLRIPVDYDTDDASYHGYATDLSETGLFIATHESFTIGQEVMITISMGDGENDLMIDATIADRTANGIQVRFEETSRRQQELIRDLAAAIGTS
jgi:Tfp pilus assembly protein PilZ